MSYDIEKKAGQIGGDDFGMPARGQAPGKKTLAQGLPTSAPLNIEGVREPFGSRIGALQAKQSQAPSKAAPKAAKGPPPQLEDVFGFIGAAYQLLLEKQAQGVEDLKEIGGKVDAKDNDFFLSLLETAASLAVTAGIGMVGELVSQSIKGIGPRWVASRTPESVKDDAALRGETVVGEESKIAAAGMKQAAKSLAKSLVKGHFDSGTGISANQRFFQSQHQALLDLAMKQQLEYHLQVRPAIREAADPLAEAHTLKDAVLETHDKAGEVQQRETMKAWALAKAKSSEGQVTKRSADGKSQVSVGVDLKRATNRADGSDGVLDLVIGWDRIPNLVGVNSAKMDGFNSGTRERLLGQAIGSLGVPVIIQVKPEHSAGCRFTIGVNEAGTIWIKNINPQGVRALSRLSGMAGARTKEGAEAFWSMVKELHLDKLDNG